MRDTLLRLRAQALHHDVSAALEEAFATAAPNYMINRLMAAQGALEDLLATAAEVPGVSSVIHNLVLTLRGWDRFMKSRSVEERNAA